MAAWTGGPAFANGEIESAEWMFQRALEVSPAFYPNAYENLQRARMTPQR